MFVFYSSDDQIIDDNLPGGSTITDLFNIVDPDQGDILAYDGSHFTNSNILSGTNTELININADNITSGVLNIARLPYLSDLDNAYLPPYISSISNILSTGVNQNIEIIGQNFTPITQLSIPGATINSLSIVSPTRIIANITTSGLLGNVNINLSNVNSSNSIWIDGIKSLLIQSDPYWQNVVLLLKGGGLNDSTNIIDSSPSAKTISRLGTARISIIQSKYGGSSIFLDRNLNNYLSIPASTDFIFPANFTIEGWIRWDGTETSGGSVLLGTGGLGSADQLGFFNGALLGYGSLSNPSYGSISNTWTHFAVCRSGSTVRYFKNGTIVNTASNSAQIGSSSNILYIGRRSDNHPFGGNIDSLRITKDIARYTNNFNPETDTFLD